MKKTLIILFTLLLIGAIGIYCYNYASERTPLDTSPFITLTGGDTYELTMGETYEEPGFKAEDYLGNDITDKVSFDQIHPEDIGEYVIKYTVTDCGRTTTAERTVIVSHAKPDPAAADYGHGIAVLMYHNVYDPSDPPANINANYISTDSLEEQLKYLVENEYYFPSWQELRDYVDGKIDLPVKSVVLTFDDCTGQFIRNGIPLLEKYDVRATSFVICSRNGKEMAEKDLKHVNFQSHSYNMHRGGGNIGHGGIFTALSHDEALDDLNKAIEILGSAEAFAYPFGDYTDDTRQVVQDAGYLAAFTTVYGKVFPGDDPLLLSRVRIDGAMSLDEFISIL